MALNKKIQARAPKKKHKYILTGEHFYKFLQCPHWIWYDIYGDQSKKGKTPPLMEMIFQDGLKHEKEIIQSRAFDEINPESFKDLDEAFYATVELMEQGKNIYHGVLMHEHWVGIPDMLEARPVPKGMNSKFGDHYYVVYDIKSSRELKDQHKMQLVFYNLILERLQGILPKEAYIINVEGEERGFLIEDFLEYFHITRQAVEQILEGRKPPPFIKSGCKQSPWYEVCLAEAEACDDVSLIYRLSQNDQKRLYDAGLKTVQDIADAELDDLQSTFLDWSFDKILRIYNQAQVLKSNKPMFLKKTQFPQVTTEVYFDVESDPTENLDYLLGALVKKGDRTSYKMFWADNKDEEKEVWKNFLEFIEKLDDFVIYHYSSYEKQVFSRLSNAYGISSELNDKFASNTIDLWRAVIESVVLPLYFYSLKDVAQYLGFEWASDDAGGAESIVWYNQWQEAKDAKIKDKIIKYNEDDVRATLFVKQWLEQQKPKPTKEVLPD